MTQTTHKHTAPFLTTVQTLTNTERLAQWERRKQQRTDEHEDDLRYLGAWLVSTAIISGGLFFLAHWLMPCLVVWTSAGIHCL